MKKKKKKRYPKTGLAERALNELDRLMFPPRQKHRHGTKTKPKKR